MSTVLFQLAATTLLVSSVGLITGCSGSQKLGGADALDTRRDGALAVFVNRKVTDQLDSSTGDTTDWKYVDIPDNGAMYVTVAFDSPRDIEGEVILRDNFATVLERHTLTADRSVYAFNPVQAQKSRYYIEIFLEDGASVYTVGVSLDQPTLAGFGQGGNFDREGVDDKKPRYTGPRKKDPVPKGDPEGNQETQEVEVVEEVVDPGKQTFVVSGYIVRVIPKDEGGTIVHIQLSGEGFELVRRGTKGTIAKLGAGVVVNQRNGSFAIGFTQAESEDCKIHKNVTFSVQK